MNPLLLDERLKNTIKLGESHFREFKSALEGPPLAKKPRPTRKICEDIGEALVAFANADGGDLLIGVEDDGAVSGLAHAQDEISAMLQATTSHVHAESKLPIVYAAKVSIDGKEVLYFSVGKGTSRVFQLPDGRCVRRQDKSTIPETPYNIEFERREIRSREYDRTFVDGANTTDLDVEFVQGMANEYMKGMSVEWYLQQIGLADFVGQSLRLRMAAILLFARNITRWHPYSSVRILKVAGSVLKAGHEYNVTSDERITGNIFYLLKESWDKLRPFLAYKTEFGVDAKFEQKYLYPEGACREALINAIAHRDYTIQAGVEIYVFDDRIEFKNPGALLSTISLDALKQLTGAHESRNALTARVLRESKLMRELGEGIRRIFELMRNSELKEPQFDSDSNSFRMTLFQISVFSSKQEQWLALFAAHQLSSPQKRIVALGMDGKAISRNDILAAIGTTDRDIYDREVTGLRRAGILFEIRSNYEATNYAERHDLRKNDVPRFEVRVPPPKVAPAVSATQVFVKGRSPDIMEEDLSIAFSAFGKITKMISPRDKRTKNLLDVVYITFESEDAAAAAVQANFVEVKGKRLEIRKSFGPTRRRGFRPRRGARR